MILRHLRRTGLLVSTVALALSVMVVAGTTDWWHQNDTDDFVPQSRTHATPHPVLKASPTGDSTSGDHCYLCHWLRNFQNGLRVSSSHAVSLTDTRHVYFAVPCGAHDASETIVPARAPPV